MPSQPTEIIDLTGSSPIAEITVIESGNEDMPDETTPQEYGKTQARKEQRKRRRTKRKRIAHDAEDGEILEGAFESLEVHSRGMSGSGRVSTGGNEAHTASANGDSGYSRTNDIPLSGKSLLERLTSPRREVGNTPRQGDAPRRDHERVSKRRVEQRHETERKEERREERREECREERKEERRRRSQSPEQRRRQRDKENERTVVNEEPPFFVDVQKVEVSASAQTVVQETSIVEKTKEEIEQSVLLLPPHVSIHGDGGTDPVEILLPETRDSDDESYIEYLDYDDDRRAPGMVRYFDPADEDEKSAKPKTIVCKHCGAEGKHKTYECPVLICLTCGARDEHSTRSCPISKTCFTCGMKGHINRTCPNRSSRRGAVAQYDCDRCGSRVHSTNECPTLWRLYNYVDDAERQEILHLREGKRTLALGKGGEGYIASDEWCYNCGGSGHLGDDCQEIAHPYDFPREPSAFGSYNLCSGPFAETSGQPPSGSRTTRAPRDWEVAGAFGDGLGFNAPMDVGKQGRRKERARMEKRAQELEEAEDDPDDWFGSRAKSRESNRSSRRGGDRYGDGDGDRDRSNGASSKAGRIKFGLSTDRDRYHNSGQRGAGERKRVSYNDLPGPSRETDSIQVRGAASRRSNGSGGSRYDPLRERNSGRRDERGPRYKGGYTR